jgi:DNA-binding CsgD family transcriptional regulator
MLRLQIGYESKFVRLNPPRIKAIALFSILTVFLCPKILSQNTPGTTSQSDEFSPRVVITKLRVLGIHSLGRTDADVGDDLYRIPNFRVIEYPKSVEIGWKEGFFLAVEFELQGSSDPGKNEYAFRIMGRDEDWIQIGNKNSIIVQNLKPGKHILIVRGANSEGIWDKEGAVLNIHVIPAWQKTSLFKMGFLMAISFVFLVFYRHVRKRYKSGLQEKIDIGRMASEFALTHREAEIIELVLQGKSIKDISQGLYISESTVQKHIYSVYKKTKVRNRLQLIHFSKRFRLK